MPLVGDRKNPRMGSMSRNAMYEYAQSFMDTQENMLRENRVDYGYEPVRALAINSNRDALKKFFVENSVVEPREALTAEQYEDRVKMMEEAFINDIQAIRENSTLGLNQYNPMVGLSLPMHKYLMLNCVFAQAVPRFVAKSPAWTETMETRFMITPDGRKIDIANQQNQIFPAWKEANPPIRVPIMTPETETTDILDWYFHVPRNGHNLSVATCIDGIIVKTDVPAGVDFDYADLPDTPGADNKLTVPDPANPGNFKEVIVPVIRHKSKEDNTTGYKGVFVIRPWSATFNPGYGEFNRIIAQPVNIMENTYDASWNITGTKEIKGSIFASQKDNMFIINTVGDDIKGVIMKARYDSSSRMLRTPRVEWSERTTFVQIPENDGITIPITPEEVKDIGANYGINQVTKVMSMIKDVMENVKDDDIHEQLDDSFRRLDVNNSLAKTIDFAPRAGYYETHLAWLRETFMDSLSQYVYGLLTILRDPNMEVCIIGRPGILDRFIPTEYSYTTPSNVGPIELNYKKTVVSSHNVVYNFISSDKMFGNDNLIILLIPKNTDRICYRLYDYQMYISNEIRDADVPSLPSLTAFQRYKFFEYQPVQGRLYIANVSGLTNFLPNIDPIGKNNGEDPFTYSNNDLSSVYQHYDPTTGRNVSTPNTL